jgi:hypothetical protein
MPTSDHGTHHRPSGDTAAPGRPARSPAFATAALSLIVAGCFAALALVGRIAIRDGAGRWRVLRIVEIWRALLDHLPPETPTALGRAPLMLALGVGGLALAYALVATLRLPQ